MLIYYVYAYLRKSNNQPYYIGKGKDTRAYDTHCGVGVPKDRSKIVFLETNLSEIGALAIERRMIAWYGRKDTGTGCLINQTDGGDGASGAVVSQTTRDRQSAARRGRIVSPETRKRNGDARRGRTHTEETKEKIRIKASGKKASDETKEKMRLAKKDISEEYRQKLRTAAAGKVRKPTSDETKEKIRAKATGRKHTEEAKEKMRIARRANPAAESPSCDMLFLSKILLS